MGFNAIIPLPKQRVFAVGADFLRIYHYDFARKVVNLIDPNNNYPNYDPCIYVKQVTSNNIIMCKKMVCYIYNLQKYASEKIIQLTAFMKFLNGDKEIKVIDKKNLNYNDDKFLYCKAFSKKEFGICYNDYIFLLNVPEGNVITHFKVDESGLYSKNNKFFKRFTVAINKTKGVKKYYFVWIEKLNLIRIFEKNEKKETKKEDVFLDTARNAVNFLSNGNDDVILINDIKVQNEVYNIK